MTSSGRAALSGITSSLARNACPACGGFGHVVAYRRDGEPEPADIVPDSKQARPDGTTYYLIRCPVCGRGRLTGYLRNLSQIPERYQDVTLDSIQPLAQQREAYRVARVVYGEPHGMMTMVGPTGVGKTWLTWALMNSLRNRYNLPGIYTTATSLLDSLRAGYDDEAEMDTARRLAELAGVAVLGIDEVDGCRWTEWAREKLGDLINLRYMNRNRLVTILAANEWGANVPAAYIRSRAADSDGCWTITLSGVDLRVAK